MQIVSAPDLGQRTSLKMGGRARLEIRVTEDADWEKIPAWMEKEGVDSLIMGGGSNLLVQEGELPLLLIKDSRERQIKVCEQKEDRLKISANAGCGLQFFLGWLQRKGITGLEGLTGIPACLGGAVAMNAGAFGKEIASAVTRLQIWSPEQGSTWLQREQILFSYRNLHLGIDTRNWIITKVELELARGDKKKILEEMKKNYRKKKQIQPVKALTCGCVFKNPDSNLSAGYLLDCCGFKGYVCGGVAFSELHANFLINLGRGNSKQAFELISWARNKVYEKFNIDLNTEVKLIGF